MERFSISLHLYLMRYTLAIVREGIFFRNRKKGLMKSIQKMEAGKYYMIESTASANSVYFETDDLAKLFFRYCNYYLKDFLQIEEYVLNKDGWAMLIKVRSAQTIRKNYETKKTIPKLQDKYSEQRESKAIWWILSERVRLFISTYVRMSNKVLGRQGSLVRRKYVRYKFDNLEQAKDYVSMIRNNRHKMEQAEEKYNGFKEHFRMSGDILTNPLRSSLWFKICETKSRIEEELVRIFGVECCVLEGIGSLVALNFKLDRSANKPPQTKPPKP